MDSTRRREGIQAALASAFFLGLAPIFGKQAILLGLSPIAVVALRTLLATLLLLVVMFLFRRKYFFIYPAGLIGCFLAGALNGTGSLLYYGALGRVDAGLGQLLYALYPLFVALWSRLDQQSLSNLTKVRLGMALPALYLLTRTNTASIDLTGMGMMLAASALYALHLPINQRVLYDMPVQTVTLYTLISMSAVVGPVYLLSIPKFVGETGLLFSTPTQAWWAVAALTLFTFLSRLTLFKGVKHLGGIQTALLGLSELVVTIYFAHSLLGERLSLSQWGGLAILVISLLLVGFETPTARRDTKRGWLHWLQRPGIPIEIDWQMHK